VRPADATVRIAALGDLMLAGEWDDVGARRGEGEAFAALRRVLADDDLVFLNLETTVEAGDGHIPKEPRVLGSIGIIERSLASLGVDLVNLANNHAFDGYLAGFEAVRAALDRAGVPWFGAGRDAAEAGRPCVVERGGVRLGWLGYVAADTRPSHVAGPASFGANALVAERAFADVERLRRTVDHVVVSLHWGVEFCHVPSPEQVTVARGLVDRGASLVIGHHAHVVQGVERYRDGVIAYGLGNATTTDFAIGGRLAIRQTPRTRSSLLLRATLDRTAVRDFTLVPLRAAGPRVVTDDAYAGRLVAKANRLLGGNPSPARWKARRFYEDVILRTLWKLDPRVIRSVRPRHVARVFQNLGGSLTGRGPA
jgi:poly-gamma-glutamate capsule biosynthesis protein CapA/YwtB (metallophosphatase superfamily)